MKTKSNLSLYKRIFNKPNVNKSCLSKAVFMSALGVLVLPPLTACKPKLTKEQEVESERLMQEVESELQLAEISKPFTEQEYPQLYEQWGKDWVEIINTMRPLAVERVRSQAECNEVAKAELSENSEVKQNPILNVSCENGEVFVISLGDITQEKRLYPMSKMFGKDPNEVIQSCLEDIQPHLMHPESISQDSINTSFNMDEKTQQLHVDIPITVKTGYNTRVAYRVQCLSDSQLKVTTDLKLAENLKLVDGEQKDNID